MGSAFSEAAGLLCSTIVEVLRGGAARVPEDDDVAQITIRVV